jgi:hypothetical protein
VNDVLITKFAEEDQIVTLYAGQDYVALQVDFDELPIGEPGEFDRTLLLSPCRADMLGDDFKRAAKLALEAS